MLAAPLSEACEPRAGRATPGEQRGWVGGREIECIRERWGCSRTVPSENMGPAACWLQPWLVGVSDANELCAFRCMAWLIQICKIARARSADDPSTERPCVNRKKRTCLILHADPEGYKLHSCDKQSESQSRQFQLEFFELQRPGPRKACSQCSKQSLATTPLPQNMCTAVHDPGSCLQLLPHVLSFPVSQ